MLRWCHHQHILGHGSVQLQITADAENVEGISVTHLAALLCHFLVLTSF